MMLPIALSVLAVVEGRADAETVRKFGLLLMLGIAYAANIGGMVTLIGTPPNIIISTYRAERMGAPFGMFDFAPVGGLVAVAGLLFLVLVGWRLAPRRKGQTSPDEVFETADYVSELTVGEEAKAEGLSLRELSQVCGETIPVVAVMRGKKRIPGHRFGSVLQTGDVLIVEAGPEELKLLEEKGGLTLGSDKFEEKLAESKDLQIAEAVVRSDSLLVNRTAGNLRLLDHHGLHLLAVARSGGRLKQRLSRVRFEAGDVLLLQGEDGEMAEHLAELGCLPLARRNLKLGEPRRLILSVALFAAAIGVILAGWLPAAVALTLAAVLSIITGVLPLREAYAGIDWPVIVLLAAMIPVGQALEVTGGAQMVADGLLYLGSTWPPVAALGILLLITLLLSNVINNAAAALLMAPIAFQLGTGFGLSVDPFLMAVAIGASCAFLTPIGHQSNTLVLGPGGYRFSDYWKVGLPLTLVVIAVTLPLILIVWPFAGR
jgi:di/tricarboxylate transporter